MIVAIEGNERTPVMWPWIVGGLFALGATVAGFFGMGSAVDSLGESIEERLPIIVLGLAVLLLLASEVSRRWF